MKYNIKHIKYFYAWNIINMQKIINYKFRKCFNILILLNIFIKCKNLKRYIIFIFINYFIVIDANLHINLH